MTTASIAPEQAVASTEAGIAWPLFHQARWRFRQRWPSVWKLRVASAPFDFVFEHDSNVRSALDVGATTRVWEPTVRRTWPGVDYRSLDIDRTYRHDYHAFDDIDRQFDLVACLEVLEHVPPAVAVDILNQCVRSARPGGLVLISVPNVLTPGSQLEFTHQTAFSHFDLAGLMSWAGLDVIDGARLCLTARRHRLVHQYLVMPLHRLMKVDFCQSVMMLGRRPVEVK